MIAATQFSVNRARSSTPGKRYRIVAPTVNGMSHRYSLARRPARQLELQTRRLPLLKKWLSYRERKVLGRALKPDEVGYFAELARRIAGILQLIANK